MAANKVAFRGQAVTIACTDKQRSERFYEGVLGAKRLPGDGYGCPWFRLGELTISLMPNASEPSRAELPAHAVTILTLEVDDLAAAHRHLLRRGVPVVEFHEGAFLMATDPDGLPIEVLQAEPKAEGA
jgi:catechol 2,3-dioxygenase-like lactoylglutathione lyase family enzyme